MLQAQTVALYSLKWSVHALAVLEDKGLAACTYFIVDLFNVSA